MWNQTCFRPIWWLRSRIFYPLFCLHNGQINALKFHSSKLDQRCQCICSSKQDPVKNRGLKCFTWKSKYCRFQAEWLECWSLLKLQRCCSFDAFRFSRFPMRQISTLNSWHSLYLFLYKFSIKVFILKLVHWDHLRAFHSQKSSHLWRRSFCFEESRQKFVQNSLRWKRSFALFLEEWNALLYNPNPKIRDILAATAYLNSNDNWHLWIWS